MFLSLCFLRRGYSNLINKMEYPIARKDFSYVDKFHGVELFDVYRWLEDPNADETQMFIEKQNKISRKFIEEGSDRYRIEKKLTTLWNYPKYSCPTKHGDYYYFYVNTGLQNHNVLFQQKHLVDEPKVFLDPNTWSEDGTIALSQKSFSEDGNYMAYGISENGSDWLKIKIRNVKSGADLKETLEKVKFSEISWTLDNKGFFYAKYDQDESADGAEVKQNENQKLYYHYVGKQQNEDILVAEFPEEPSWRMEEPKIKQQTQPKQFEILVDFMKAHPDLSKGSLKTPDHTRKNGPPLRDIAGWKKIWADYKIHLKAKMRRNKNNISGTGGGPLLFILLSQLEHQVFELLSIEESINGMSGTLSFGAAISSMSEVNADPTEPNTQNSELPQCSKVACTPHKKQQTPLNTQENELPQYSNVTYPPRKKQQILLERKPNYIPQ